MYCVCVFIPFVIASCTSTSTNSSSYGFHMDNRATVEPAEEVYPSLISNSTTLRFRDTNFGNMKEDWIPCSLYTYSYIKESAATISSTVTFI